MVLENYDHYLKRNKHNARPNSKNRFQSSFNAQTKGSVISDKHYPLEGTKQVVNSATLSEGMNSTNGNKKQSLMHHHRQSGAPTSSYINSGVQASGIGTYNVRSDHRPPRH